jgi:flagellar biosynthesis/type III secretory pathway protein FliH
MYDPLLEEDPWVQEVAEKRSAVARAEGIAEGKAEGIAEGKAEGIAEGEMKGTTKGIRQGIEAIIQMRFPDLREPVIKQVREMQDPIALQTILVVLSMTHDDLQARRYLQSL